MKSNVEILFAEPFSKKGYSRIVGRSIDSKGNSRLATCFAHRSSFPDVRNGDVVDAVVYRNGYDLRFEPICDVINVDEDVPF